VSLGRASAERGANLMMGTTAEGMMVQAVQMLRYHKLPTQMSIVLSMANNMVDVLQLEVGSPTFRRCAPPRAPAPTVLKMIK